MEDSADLKTFLNEKVEKFNQPSFIETDPIQVPRRFSQKENVEISAFFTATIAWGNRLSIIQNANRLMTHMDNQPYDFVLHASHDEKKQLNNFVHRTFNGSDCIYFIESLKNIYTKYDGLQSVFEKGFRTEHSVKSALIYFYDKFFELPGERTRKHVSNVSKGASAKRLNMYIRTIEVVEKFIVNFLIFSKLKIKYGS